MKKIIFLLILNVNIFPGSFSGASILYGQVYGVNKIKPDNLSGFFYDNAIPGPADDGNLHMPYSAEDTTHGADSLSEEKMYAFGFGKDENYIPGKGSPASIQQDLAITTRSPCSPQSIANGSTITNFFKTAGYQSGFNDLVRANVPGVGREFAAVYGINYSTGLPTNLPIITTSAGTSVSINVNPPDLSVTAIGHTHPDNVFPAPSAGDLYAFGNYAQFHPDFLYYILAANGSNYVLMVTDTADLLSFLRSFPQDANIEPDSLGNPGRGANYKPGSELYLTMQQVATNILSKSVDPANPTLVELDIAHEAVQAYILDHYKTGMTLFKQDANGNFNEIHAAIDATNSKSRISACN